MQPTLFDQPVPLQECVTCGERAVFLEPVSQECVACNHATLDELHAAYAAGDVARTQIAYQRHNPNSTKPVRIPRRTL